MQSSVMGTVCSGERTPDNQAKASTVSAAASPVAAVSTSSSSSSASKGAAGAGAPNGTGSGDKANGAPSKGRNKGREKVVLKPVPGESAQMKRLREDELEKLLRELYNPSRKEIEEFIKRFDLNGDNELSFEEYQQGIVRVNPEWNKPEYEQLIRDKFDAFDTNGDKKLSGKELEEVARDTLAINPNMRKRAMMLFDKDNSKTVTFEEFVETIDRLRGNLSIIWKSQREVSKK